MKEKKLILSAFIGGLIVFLWSLFSWVTLPWHAAVFQKFTDESSVAHAIKHNAPVDGIYLLPNTYTYNSNTAADEIQCGMSMMERGPTLFASVHVGGLGDRSFRPFVISFILQVLGAGIVSWMLLQTQRLKPAQKVAFVTLFGFAIGILGILPAWNWWCFPLNYTASILFDLMVGWFLAGLVIAKICK